MDSNSILFTHVTSAAAFAYALQLLQKWAKTPWVTEHTTGVNVALRAIFSLFASFGINWAWTGSSVSGWSVTITIPALAVLGHGVFHLFGQFALQHGWLKLFQLGDAKPA